jgi:hypothetical protein
MHAALRGFRPDVVHLASPFVLGAGGLAAARARAERYPWDAAVSRMLAVLGGAQLRIPSGGGVSGPGRVGGTLKECDGFSPRDGSGCTRWP